MLTVPLILESPGLIPWLVFFLYAILLVVGLYYLSRTFVQYRIVYGHLDDLFRFLTSLRIWSIRYRKSYPIAVVLVFFGAKAWFDLGDLGWMHVAAGALLLALHERLVAVHIHA